MEALCAALQDPRTEVRAAAAESLGEIGDPGAVPALTAALRRCFLRGSARMRIPLGLATLLGGAALYLGIMFGAFDGGHGVSFAGGMLLGNVVLQSVLAYRRSRTSHGQASAAISGALVKLSEKEPRPELRGLLPVLRAVELDVLQQDRKTRLASRQAVRRIEELTAELEALPVAVAAPAAPVGLPRPVGRPDVEAERLPRPAAPGGR